MISDDELRAKLVATFKVELDEYMVSLNPALIELERDGSREDLLHDAFRTVHNLKGAAGAIGLATVLQIAHNMENILGAVRRKEFVLTPDGFDLCYQGVDLIQSVVERELAGGVVPDQLGTLYEKKCEAYLNGQFVPVGSQPVAAPPTAARVGPEPEPDTAVLDKMTTTTDEQAPAPTVDESQPVQPRDGSAGAQTQSIRMPLFKIDRLMSDVSELLVSRNQYEERDRELRRLGGDLSGALKDWSMIRGLRRKLSRNLGDQDVERFLELVDAHQSRLKGLYVQWQTLASRASNDRLHLDMSVSAVQQEVQDLRMVPIGTIFEPLRRAARDQARKQDKRVLVEFRGGETELDRQLVEAIKDPIMHLIRNSIDHGLEPLAVREKIGKAPDGNITISAEQRGNQIVVEISDDGGGIKLDLVKAKAASLGWFNERELEALTPQELLALVFRPGFSTARAVTETAGRGVGLDVVKVNVERMQGQVEVFTTRDVGTTFRITLPLTLSTLHVLLIRCAQQMLAIPVASVERALRLTPEKSFSVESHLAISFENRAVSLLRLDGLLGLKDDDKDDSDIWTILVMYHGGERLAFIVDEILGEQELVIKSLGKQLRRVRNLSGGAVMGDGSVVLLLNPADLLRSARGERDISLRARPREAIHVRHKILVVDDSITTRTLEKNILEAAGYEVILAKDGEEGFQMASNSGCELVISDIEMPRMNGFDLTAKIKGDDALGTLPVILVSSLASPQFKARGAQVGADAYIVKGEFDQGHFLKLVSSMLES